MNTPTRDFRRDLLTMGSAILAVPSWCAQESLGTYVDLWTTEFRATPLDSIDDIDGDGFRDLILGDTGVREVRLLSGLTGDALSTFIVDGFDDLAFGKNVAGIGDVTGDGVGDFVASGDQGYLWSGATLERIWSGPLFDSATTIGDIDGDGLTDYVLAGYGFVGNRGWATVYHGGRHTPAYSLMAPLDAHRYGHASVGLGDVDGDGLGDFAIGAPGSFLSDTICVPGGVYVHSGVDGHLLHALEGEGVGSFFGGSLAAPGDFTGDGIADLAVGAMTCCVTDCEQVGSGRISLYDGPTGQLVRHVLPEVVGVFLDDAFMGFGGSLLSIGDLDGNGHDDILTSISVRYGPNSFFTGTLLALDGGSWEPIYRVWNPYADACVGFGRQRASAGEVNGDDFPDYFVSTSCATIGQPDDRVDLFSGAPIGVRSLGTPCGQPASGRALRIGATGVPEVGVNYAIHVSGVEPGTRARLLLGDLRPGRPRSTSGRCAPLVQAVEVRDVVAKEVQAGEGVATALVAIPNDPGLIGMEFHAQWWLPDSAPSSTTRVLEIEIQPINPLRGW